MIVLCGSAYFSGLSFSNSKCLQRSGHCALSPSPILARFVRSSGF